MSDQPNGVSRPHVSDETPNRHVDIGTPPNRDHQEVKNDLGATAINGAQYGPYKDHPHGH
jgi:hypothetical protein